MSKYSQAIATFKQQLRQLLDGQNDHILEQYEQLLTMVPPDELVKHMTEFDTKEKEAIDELDDVYWTLRLNHS